VTGGAAVPAAVRAAEGDRGEPQTVRALLALRNLLLEGTLAPGERLAELHLVERLGVSRTPIRLALVKLAEEGLIDVIPSGGYAVRAFTDRDVADAIEIRGTLEGLAARLAAERGATPRDLRAMRDCVADLDAVVAGAPLTEAGMAAYIEGNARFHEMLGRLADSPGLTRQMERALALPFASPSAFVKAQVSAPESHFILTVAQDQHRCVVDAIERREGARAEAIMREHARIANRNLAVALRSRAILDLVPGGQLIRGRA
jgi:GntR family transcriptional regulator, vanillate catabolism transcriptional regulator